MVGPPAPDEEGVAESVHIGDADGVDGLVLGELAEQPLHAAADRPAEVKVGVEARTAWQDEAPERFEACVAAVHLGLQLLHVGLADARLAGVHILREGGEDGAQVEEGVLHPAEQPSEAGELRVGGVELERGHPSSPDEGVELIYLAVAGDARAGLRHNLSADQRGGAFVAFAGVDAVDGDALGGVELFTHPQLRLGGRDGAAT